MKPFYVNIQSNVTPELPILPQVFYEELERNFNIDFLLTSSTPKNNDELCGYIRGVRDVLARIRVLAHIEEDKE